MIGKIAFVAALACAPLAWSAASATDAQDAYYQSCVDQYVARNMGTPDAAAAYCYPKAYPNEGGGYPGTDPGAPSTTPGPKCEGCLPDAMSASMATAYLRREPTVASAAIRV